MTWTEQIRAAVHADLQARAAEVQARARRQLGPMPRRRRLESLPEWVQVRPYLHRALDDEARRRDRR